MYLKKVLKDHFRSIGTEVSIKYNDPSYMIRSVPANASDAIYCMILAQNAVVCSSSTSIEDIRPNVLFCSTVQWLATPDLHPAS